MNHPVLSSSTPASQITSLGDLHHKFLLSPPKCHSTLFAAYLFFFSPLKELLRGQRGKSCSELIYLCLAGVQLFTATLVSWSLI